MIIRPDGDALLFITQPDHARLAGDLATHWMADELPSHPRREDILLAVREHDNGWREIDEELLYDPGEGRARDFVAAPEEVKQAVWPRAIDRVAASSAYAAALVARHAAAVYQGFRDTVAWRPFFESMREREEALRMRAGAVPSDVDRDYRVLAVADLLSLSFCNGWADVHERQGVRVRTRGATTEVEPAILGTAPVPARVRGRRLEARRYASAADLRAAYEAAPLILLEGAARGGALS